jgi:hypothetical protein
MVQGEGAGWHREPQRHALASRGIKTGSKGKVGKPIFDRGKMKQAMLPSMDGADKVLVSELILWEENTSELTQRQGDAIRRNYLRYMEKGKYDHDLAIQGVMNLYAKNVLESYNKGTQGDLKMDKATSRFFAEVWVRGFEHDAKNHELDHLLEKN